MTGNLTITDTVGAFNNTLYLGAGNDTISDTVDGQVTTIYGNDGDDTITTGTGADKVYGGAGNDTITAGGTAGDTIDAGAGDDTVTAAHADDKITLGAGSDIVIVAKNTDIEVTDFNKSEDTIVITGSGASAVDLSSTTVSTSGTYTIDTTADFTLTGVTDTDVTGFVQLGSSTTAFTLATGTTNIAGAKDDNLAVATTTSATVTTGDGSDTVTIAIGNGSAVTIKDFTTGSDKVVITGTIDDGESVDLSSVTAPTSGKYVIGGSTASDNVDITLENGGTAFTATDISSMVQLGSSSAYFTLDATSNGTISATGGIFDDYVDLGTLGTGSTTFNFTDNGGVDYVKGIVVNSAASVISFTDMSDITGTGTAVAANATKISDATDGAVYVFADASDGTGSEAISTFVENTANGITEDTILADVAAFLNAGLGTASGETYVAVINEGGGTDANEAYAYLVHGNNDGLTASDISLIGVLNTTVADAAITATDIA